MCVGGVVLALVCVGAAYWLTGLGDAALETSAEMANRDGRPDYRSRGLDRDVRGIGISAMLGAIGLALLALLFTLISFVNGLRFVTRTGLKEPGAW